VIPPAGEHIAPRDDLDRYDTTPDFADGSADTELSLLADAKSAAIEWRMVAAANMVEVAALVGDTARATMLSALMGGQALTASELAARARISKSTASGRLTKLVGARLLAVMQKRRNRYYRIASPLVATMRESIMRESIKTVAAIALRGSLLLAHFRPLTMTGLSPKCAKADGPPIILNL
jgi:DNA-binding transcriptional ArsR family regulator